MSANDPKRTSASISCCSSEAGFSPYQSTRLRRTMPSPEPGGGHEAAGISRCSGWCGSGVAARGARAAARADAAHRRAADLGRGRSRRSCPHRGFAAGAAASGLDRRSQCAVDIAGPAANRRRSQTRGRNWSLRRRTSSSPLADHRWSLATGDPHRPDRVRAQSPTRSAPDSSKAWRGRVATSPGL